MFLSTSRSVGSTMRSPLAKLIGSMVLISLSAYTIAGWEYRRPLVKWSASSLPRRRCSGPLVIPPGWQFCCAPTVSKHLACLRECGLVASDPLGRASVFRLTQPPLADLLSCAEEVLAATGNAVALCPNYGRSSADGAEVSRGTGGANPPFPPTVVPDAEWHRAARWARWQAWVSLAWMLTGGAIRLWHGLLVGSIAPTGWALRSAVEGLAGVIVVWLHPLTHRVR